jgi:hypothetical protein
VHTALGEVIPHHQPRLAAPDHQDIEDVGISIRNVSRAHGNSLLSGIDACGRLHDPRN